MGWLGRCSHLVDQCATIQCPNVRAYSGGSDGPLRMSGIMRHVPESHPAAVHGVVVGRNRPENWGHKVASVSLELASRADALGQQDFNLDWRGSQRQTVAYVESEIFHFRRSNKRTELTKD